MYQKKCFKECFLTNESDLKETKKLKTLYININHGETKTSNGRKEEGKKEIQRKKEKRNGGRKEETNQTEMENKTKKMDIYRKQDKDNGKNRKFNEKKC